MYLSRIQIEGFRNFKNVEVEFNEGINVIIGHNNAGKTNLLRALALVLDNSDISKRLTVDDFYKGIDLSDLRANPPSVRISLYLSEGEDENLYEDDLVTVSKWITKLESPYEARLTYEFFLPEKEKEEYEKSLAEPADVEEAWRLIKRDFIRQYRFKVYGGNPQLQIRADEEGLQKFDFQFLDAIRDVERDMFTGRSTLLREVLQFFMDYDIKKGNIDVEQQKQMIKKRQKEFENRANPVLGELLKRIGEGKKEILDYATKTGASFDNAKPEFEGIISEADLLSALRLIIEHQTGIKIPATHNGLGYNNLIYMSLLLAKMQANADGNYYGSNAKVYPILVIEEPEAHLHPSMQFKLLKFLKENRKKKVRQVFVTSHSTHITSAVSLDDIICLHNENKVLNVGYPGKVFGDSTADKVSKGYVERFLDATRSNMLFAQKVILVEGTAEQILMPTFARITNKDKDLDDFHVVVVSVGGRYFGHFLKLFDSTKPNTIRKRVACIIDRDPERRQKSEDSFKKCYPFEFEIDKSVFDYRENASGQIALYDAHPNIRYFSQDLGKGKTLEYEIILANPDSDLLITDSTSNGEELRALMKAYRQGKGLDDFELRSSPENERIKSGVLSPECKWKDDDKKRALIAARYLNSVAKGGNALELSVKLESGSDLGAKAFVVPQYVKDAIEWLLQ